MIKNHSKLIACPIKRTLTAYSYRIQNTMLHKAAELQGLSIYHNDFKPTKETIQNIVTSLIFDHNITAEQLSKLNKQIRVNKANKIEIGTSEIFLTNG